MVLSLQTVHRVDDIVARHQADGRAPSLVAAVVRDGAAVHVSAAGEVPAPTRDTQYRIGSITKTMTAAVLIGLCEEGRADLDDAISDHLPVPGLERVRLRQLLAHSAGLQREPDGDWWERTAGVPLDRLLTGVTGAKLAAGPYRGFHYSNLAYGLLGGLIERLTGQSWWDAVSTRLLLPLGLTRTTYHPAEPFARGYLVHPWHQSVHEEPREDAGAMAPAGQLWSTVDDLSRWAGVLGAGSTTTPGAVEPGVVRPGVVAQMVAPAVIGDPDAWTGGYGLGLHLWRRGERVFVGHTGSMPGYLAVLAVHRPTGTGAVVFANTYRLKGSSIAHIGLSIVESVLDLEPAPLPPAWRPGTTPPADIAELCGRWWWMGHELEARWDEPAEELVLSPPDDPAPAERWRFGREGSDRWRGRSGRNAGEILTVRRDPAGTPTALDIATFVFTRDESMNP